MRAFRGIGFLALFFFLFTACQSEADSDTASGEARVAEAMNEMESEFSQAVREIGAEMEELREKADQAAEEANEELAEEYREAARQLDGERTTLRDRWAELKDEVGNTWEDAGTQLDSFRGEMQSVMDSVERTVSGIGGSGGSRP